MNIYRWRSKAMRQYNSGFLISFGETADEARNRILAGIKPAAKEHFEYLFYPGLDSDGDEFDTIQEWCDQIVEDLKGEPEVAQSFYIQGSE